MSPNAVLRRLDRVVDLGLAHVAVASAPGLDPDLAEDLPAVLLALHFALRRYRDAIVEATGDNAADHDQRWPSPKGSRGSPARISAMAII